MKEQIVELRRLAEVCESRGDAAGAETIYGRIVALVAPYIALNDLEYVEDLYRLGLNCYAQRKFSKAEACLEQVRQIEEGAPGCNAARLERTVGLLRSIREECLPVLS